MVPAGSAERSRPTAGSGPAIGRPDPSSSEPIPLRQFRLLKHPLPEPDERDDFARRGGPIHFRVADERRQQHVDRGVRLEMAGEPERFDAPAPRCPRRRAAGRPARREPATGRAIAPPSSPRLAMCGSSMGPSVFTSRSLTRCRKVRAGSAIACSCARARREFPFRAGLVEQRQVRGVQEGQDALPQRLHLVGRHQVFGQVERDDGHAVVVRRGHRRRVRRCRARAAPRPSTGSAPPAGSWRGRRTRTRTRAGRAGSGRPAATIDNPPAKLIPARPIRWPRVRSVRLENHTAASSIMSVERAVTW